MYVLGFLITWHALPYLRLKHAVQGNKNYLAKRLTDWETLPTINLWSAPSAGQHKEGLGFNSKDNRWRPNYVNGVEKDGKPNSFTGCVKYKSYCTHGTVENKIESFSSRFSIFCDSMSSYCDLYHAPSFKKLKTELFMSVSIRLFLNSVCFWLVNKTTGSD